jgi:hypothetical protein
MPLASASSVIGVTTAGGSPKSQAELVSKVWRSQSPTSGMVQSSPSRDALTGGVSLPTIGSTVIVLHSGMMIVWRCGTERKAIAFDTVVVQLTFARRHEIVLEGRDPRPNI